MRRLGFLATGLLLSCTSRGCDTGHRITVRYRGEGTLIATAQVLRDGEQAGYVEAVAAEPGLQHVKLRVRDAAMFTDKDTYTLVQDDRGKAGFRVTSGPGKPLFDGAIVEAVPDWELREKVARLAAEAPHGITLPSGYYVPYPQALTRERVSSEERFAKTLGERIPRTLDVKQERLPSIDGGTVARFQTFAQDLKGKSAEEIKMKYESEGRPLRDDIKAQFETARAAHDSQRMHDLRVLEGKLERVEMQIKRYDKAQKVMQGRPRRERHLPPELR